MLHTIAGLVISLLLAYGTAYVGAVVSPGVASSDWYDNLKKPEWNPPQVAIRSGVDSSLYDDGDSGVDGMEPTWVLCGKKRSCNLFDPTGNKRVLVMDFFRLASFGMGPGGNNDVVAVYSLDDSGFR